ncbi:MAG: nucleotidyltransferase domain-containing protein [Gammaproteobacteria bacterium]
MIDLREKDQQALIDIAGQTLPADAQLWAYGSRVKGTNHDTSDLDLVIKMPAGQTLPLDTLDEFQTALRDSNIPILIQAFDWDRLPQTFHANILAAHEVLWAGAES